MHRRTTARAVGALFIVATVAGVLSLAFLGLQHDPDSLANASANRDQIALGVFLVLVMVFAIAMIPAVLFPILKGHNEALALGYVISRIVEVVALLPAAVAPLLLVELSAEYTAAGAPDAAHFRTLRTLLLTYDDWGLPVSKIAFCLGALILYYLLYRSILVPRFISVWGLVGAALYLADSLFVMFGLLASSSALQIAVTVPIAVNEMVLAVWLIVKGFNQPSAIVSGVTKTDIDKARQPSANW